MNKKKIEDIGSRALKTFIQAFLSSLAITLPSTDFSQEGVWKSVIIGAVAYGLSAIMNYASNLMNKEEMEND